MSLTCLLISRSAPVSRLHPFPKRSSVWLVRRATDRAPKPESAHRAGPRAMECGLIAGQAGLLWSAGHTFREHGRRHSRVAGFSERSGRVIRTRKSGFREEDLGGGEPFEDVHGALAERAWPGSRLVQGRCLGCWRRLVEQETAEWQQIFAGTVGQPAEVADAREASR